ncbi:MAG: 2-oxoacid:acceptor oxidoreductase subunit alpha [Nitrososphaerota archaeon]|jgi:2-oxoglutarate ferredoxin oxidoreductase subunit alpha|nr:2-oxoacid:acceptor oxidoreductase subunit alpha [Nitrososphaerota archaeon]
MTTDLTWLIGGPQGSGVESGANIFSKVCAGVGYQIFGKREFYSNIKGEHSYFAVRISDKKIHSNVNDINMMVAFDAEMIFRHMDEVVEGGAIIYDSDLEKTTTDDVHTLDFFFKSRLEKYLKSKNKEFSIKGILETAKERGVNLLPVSFREILSKLAEDTNNPRLKGMIRMFNVIGVSLSLGVLGLEPKPLLDSIESIFSKKPKVAEINKQAATYAYNYAAAKFDKINISLNSVTKEPDTILVQGHQGTAIGKMVCGCRFQPYYPITPASDESVYLESNELLTIKEDRPGSTVVVQTEDEISAIGMMIGGALTGTRSSTCTSGPGFSLMAEAMGWAGINEVPCVITNYQRSGPSTGLPTRHGQDDLLFAINAGHGEFPRIVYASGDIEESFYDTGKCFNFSDVFQVLVIHLLDKFISSSVITCKRFDPEKVNIDRGKLLEKIEKKPYKRFELTPDGISPRSKLGLEDGIFWNTGDERDEDGHISEDPLMRIKMMDKRLSRFDLILKQIPKEDQVVSFGMAEHCIISWGSAKGPILDALDMLKKENINIGFIQLKLLHPFPTKYVKELLKDVKTIIDVEANYTGQLGTLFKQNLGRDVDYFILKFTGRSMNCTEVYDSLKKILENKAEKREILTHGA